MKNLIAFSLLLFSTLSLANYPASMKWINPFDSSFPLFDTKEAACAHYGGTYQSDTCVASDTSTIQIGQVPICNGQSSGFTMINGVYMCIEDTPCPAGQTLVNNVCQPTQNTCNQTAGSSAGKSWYEVSGASRTVCRSGCEVLRDPSPILNQAYANANCWQESTGQYATSSNSQISGCLVPSKFTGASCTGTDEPSATRPPATQEQQCLITGGQWGSINGQNICLPPSNNTGTTSGTQTGTTSGTQTGSTSGTQYNSNPSDTPSTNTGSARGSTSSNAAGGFDFSLDTEGLATTALQTEGNTTLKNIENELKCEDCQLPEDKTEEQQNAINQEVKKTTDLLDGIEGDYSIFKELGWSNWIPDFPTSSCTAYTSNVKGVSFTWNFCPYVQMISDTIGWLWALFGAWTITGTFFRRGD